MVHFLLAEDLVHEREADLRRAAVRVRCERTRRERLGWILVETGLRLVTAQSSTARRTSPA
ncbi:hypothetical protein SAMN05421837_101158 [Amycolatopsis pretoriensis]|uniref:Uncharacterized protein n=1 Tax=Amycolatopsis pretoriensis TaxID=218821 RepID=A0A1H5Q3B8_9PSEU|nr:hypothetical protein SAMN05421837_101158 [Amycolatopsis pretoriensis]